MTDPADATSEGSGDATLSGTRPAARPGHWGEALGASPPPWGEVGMGRPSDGPGEGAGADMGPQLERPEEAPAASASTPTPPPNTSTSADRRLPTASTTQMRVHLAEHHDALTGELVLRHVPGRRVVDLGVGSPAISEWVANRAARLASVPLATIEQHALASSAAVAVADAHVAASAAASSGGATAASSAESAHPRGPALPLQGDAFDVALILHTLPHLGQDAASSTAMARWLLAEAARILRPGGVVLVDIANPRSLAGLVAGVRNPATAIRQVPGGTLVIGPGPGRSSRRASDGEFTLHHAHDRERITRYDTLGQLHRLAPASLEDVEVHGIGVFAPRARVLSVPVVGGLLRRLDWFARDGLFLRYFGARLLIVLRKLPAARRRSER